MANWTQPQCERCWTEKHGDREPVRSISGRGPAEQCAWCGGATWAGIFVRADPKSVPFPAEDDE